MRYFTSRIRDSQEGTAISRTKVRVDGSTPNLSKVVSVKSDDILVLSGVQPNRRFESSPFHGLI
jgi:hypothetical protein